MRFGLEHIHDINIPLAHLYMPAFGVTHIGKEREKREQRNEENNHRERKHCDIGSGFKNEKAEFERTS